MYLRLTLLTAFNIVAMFLLTYALIASFDHFYPNINRAYMAIIMAAPMVAGMMVVMGRMYPNARLNTAIGLGACAVFALVFSAARLQAFVGNEQFLRSMISHHSSAVVMCDKSSITDPEIIDLCETIVDTQLREIRQMQDILARL